MSIYPSGSCNMLFARESVCLGNNVKFIYDEFRERGLMEEIEGRLLVIIVSSGAVAVMGDEAREWECDVEVEVLNPSDAL
jgi:hypothetical protein